MLIPVVGRVYTLNGENLVGGGYVDSADMPLPYGIRVMRQERTSNNPHAGKRIYFDVVGSPKHGRKRSGSMLLTTFQRRARRELTNEQAEILARGERIPVEP